MFYCRRTCSNAIVSGTWKNHDVVELVGLCVSIICLVCCWCTYVILLHNVCRDNSECFTVLMRCNPGKKDNGPTMMTVYSVRLRIQMKFTHAISMQLKLI